MLIAQESILYFKVFQILTNIDTDHPNLMQLEIDCLGNFDIGTDPIRSTPSWSCHVVAPINAELRNNPNRTYPEQQQITQAALMPASATGSFQQYPIEM